MLIFTPLSNIKRVSAGRFKWGTAVKGVVLDNKNTHSDAIYHTIEMQCLLQVLSLNKKKKIYCR